MARLYELSSEDINVLVSAEVLKKLITNHVKSIGFNVDIKDIKFVVQEYDDHEAVVVGATFAKFEKKGGDNNG